MDRNCFITQKDENGVTHDFEVHYFVTQKDNEGRLSVVIKSVTEDNVFVEMDEEMVNEITELCLEDYDDENWDYQKD